MYFFFLANYPDKSAHFIFFLLKCLLPWSKRLGGEPPLCDVIRGAADTTQAPPPTLVTTLPARCSLLAPPPQTASQLEWKEQSKRQTEKQEAKCKQRVKCAVSWRSMIIF